MNKTVINLPELQNTLADRLETDLVFSMGGTQINTGYHVTEVKQAIINSLDCGNGTDQWQELIIQLLDGSVVTNSSYMSCEKFLGILNASTGTLDTPPDTHLYFEFSPGNGGIQRLQVTAINAKAATTEVCLSGAKPQCKPMAKRWNAAKSKLSSCCQPDKETTSCCNGESDLSTPDHSTRCC